MNAFELSQITGSIVGGALGTLVGWRSGPVGAVAGLFVGALAGMALATTLSLLILWVVRRIR